jgi:hypothetical protein
VLCLAGVVAGIAARLWGFVAAAGLFAALTSMTVKTGEGLRHVELEGDGDDSRSATASPSSATVTRHTT